jgi:hypothetical protein
MRRYLATVGIFLTFALPVSVPAAVDTPPVIPVGDDAYLQWQRWPYQRIGARAYMRSTYDRHGNNDTADASHYLYQEGEDFNVTLDVEGAGMLYFARYNFWHGSPWHYEVDGQDYVVEETTTGNPRVKLTDARFMPEAAFPTPLTWTYSSTKGADLSWVPVGFTDRFRMAYGNTYYGTGYYIYHKYMRGAALSRPISAWSDTTQPDPAVLELIGRAGTDIAPPDAYRVEGTVNLAKAAETTLVSLDNAPAMIRAIEISAPANKAVALDKVRLRIHWDKRKLPSVDAPLPLFFGAGTLHNSDQREYLVKALPVSVRFTQDRVQLAAYFPMPYFSSARLELVNEGDETIEDIQWSVRTVPYEDPKNHVAYFHASFKDHGQPDTGRDLVLLDTRGIEAEELWSGHFIGTSFIFSERSILHTLEGDPRFFFDDSKSPQAYGTGTEEWGGGGDFWGGQTMTLPFAGHPTGVGSARRAIVPEDMIESAYRYLLADLMPFGRRAQIHLEHGGTNESDEHYRTLTYWYGVPSPTLILTDSLNVGDKESESSHDYLSVEASEPYAIQSRYEWGPDETTQPTFWHASSKPESAADFTFEAKPDTTYNIWVRKRYVAAMERNHYGNAHTMGWVKGPTFWLQFDGHIGTRKVDPAHGKMGAVRKFDPPTEQWTWAAHLMTPDAAPLGVAFTGNEEHHLRIQPRAQMDYIDTIWLSTTQTTPPTDQDFLGVAENPAAGEIILNASSAVLTGASGFTQMEGSLNGNAIALNKVWREVYPAHEEIARSTNGSSEFTLAVNPDNLGVLLRRTLDYAAPHQRARVFIADANAKAPDWKDAGVWYTAGATTHYYSVDKDNGELGLRGTTQPVVQTSNRRFRDDEFLVPRDLTNNRSSIRVRVVHEPIDHPLLPGYAMPDPVWTEIRYQAYSYQLPDAESW